METIELRNKLHHYIKNAQEKKLQAIFTMIEDEIKETYNHWNDEDFVNKLQQKEQAYSTGKSKTYTANESAFRAYEAVVRYQ